MASKRRGGVGERRKTHSYKTKKRLEIKRKMLEERVSKDKHVPKHRHR